MTYTELNIECSEPWGEILQAELAEIGFNYFVDHDKGFFAYAEAEDFDREGWQAILDHYQPQTKISWSERQIPKENWNKAWESYYEPIVVNDACAVRATFHEPMPDYRYEIVITPKMSFGTGHHATTRLMLQHQMEVSHEGRRVADLGCGTGILAIMAGMLKAAEVDACDIEEWAVENSRENAGLNKQQINFQQGTLAEVGFQGPYDIILANINTNVLLEEIPAYAALLPKGAQLILSGFYDFDADAIVRKASEHGLQEEARKMQDRWTAIRFEKVQ